MSNHTPGPWTLSEMTKKGKRHLSVDNEWEEFASVYVKVGKSVSSEGEANARLIRAAPELFSALVGMLEATALSRRENVQLSRTEAERVLHKLFEENQ